MKPRVKVAIYAGKLPTTTFIERLAISLVLDGIEVTLIGKTNAAIRSPHPKINIISYGNGVIGAVAVLWQAITLWLFYAKRYRAVKQSLHGSVFTSKVCFVKW